MGHCFSIPSGERQYVRDKEDAPVRHFGQRRSGSVLVPDDCGALPSAFIQSTLPSDTEVPLYEAEIDQGQGWRFYRILMPIIIFLSLPFAALAAVFKTTLTNYGLSCDQACCWVRKEYTTRSFFKVYSNRIQTNKPLCRLFGMLGCGSWTGDHVLNHMFDRGAFDFRRVNAGVISYFCCIWPVYGWTMARQRCQCNGPPWHGGWWCEEWICNMCFCTYRYTGLADADECAFASSIALQAFFEGRKITKEDMDKCVEYYKENIAEITDPEGRKRDVCCEPWRVPCIPSFKFLHENCCHMRRNNPYTDDDPRNTTEVREMYEKYNELCKKQNHVFKTYTYPKRKSTVCQAFGCKRFCGRKGLIFCTEGCDNLCFLRKKNKGDPPPPFDYRDIDDENDASLVLRKVLGEPPANCLYTRWVFDEEKGENVLITYPTLGGDIETGEGSLNPQNEGDVASKLQDTSSNIEEGGVEITQGGLSKVKEF